MAFKSVQTNVICVQNSLLYAIKSRFYKNDSQVWKYFVILQANYKTT